MTPGDNIRSGFDTKFLPNFIFLSLNLSFFKRVRLDGKNILYNFFSTLYDGYPKRLVSLIEWPAEMNL